MEQNNMTRKEYIKEHIIWSLLVFLWFRNLLFRCIPKFTYTESLLGFVILSVIVMAICIALTWNRNRNYWNLIENIILCWGVFVCITYMNLYHTRIVYVGIATAAISLLLSIQFTLDDGTGTDRTILSGIHAYYEPEELVGKTLIAITNLPPRAMMGIESCGMLLSAVCEENGEEKLNLLMVDNHIPAGAKLY